jgi:predicted phage tail protein
MSNKPCSLNVPARVPKVYNADMLKILSSELGRCFGNFIEKFAKGQSEAKELKSMSFLVISKWSQAYDSLIHKNKIMKDEYERIQKEAGNEWNKRQSELIAQIQGLENKVGQLCLEIKSFQSKKNSLADSLADIYKTAHTSFSEVIDKLKQENIQFETAFQIEKSLFEILESLKKQTKPDNSNSDTVHSLEYNKVIKINNLNTFDLSKRTVSDSLSSLSNFLENTYQHTDIQKSRRTLTNDSFLTQTDFDYSGLDSFATLREDKELLENTVSTIFPPIEQENSDIPIIIHKINAGYSYKDHRDMFIKDY